MNIIVELSLAVILAVVVGLGGGYWMRKRTAEAQIGSAEKQAKKILEEAETKGESNCPLCAIGHDANKNKIWKLAEMDADHVSAWSKGGATDASNCQLLCKTHNRAKGNR